MNLHPNIEQVGFIEIDNQPRLIMAGNEFCGNATRSATYFYLKGKQGKIKIKVCDDIIIEAGIDSKGNVWSHMPVYSGSDVVTIVETGTSKVKMEGIIHFIIGVQKTKELLSAKEPTKEIYKELALNVFNRYAIDSYDAVGAMFLEEKEEGIKIHPVVWVKSIDTLFYETACGSGTIAVAILETINKGLAQELKIIQPSEKIITARTWFGEGRILHASISGKIETDEKQRKIEIN